MENHSLPVHFLKSESPNAGLVITYNQKGKVFWTAIQEDKKITAVMERERFLTYIQEFGTHAENGLPQYPLIGHMKFDDEVLMNFVFDNKIRFPIMQKSFDHFGIELVFDHKAFRDFCLAVQKDLAMQVV